MTARTRALRQGRQLLIREGEEVRLPSGARALGILTRQGEPAEPGFPTAGLEVQIGDIANPSIWLSESDAEGLVLHNLLRVDGVDYRITAPPRPDGDGLAQIELAIVDVTTDTVVLWQ